MNDKAIEDNLPIPGGQHADAQQGQDGPGTVLAERRQELNLSVDEVARHLNMAPRQIAAIESNDYAALPGMAVARGFIRAYAKLLKLDPAPLIALTANQTEAVVEEPPLRRALPAKPFYERTFLSNKRSGWGKKAALIFLLVVAAILLAWGMGWVPRSWSRLNQDLPPLPLGSGQNEAASGKAVNGTENALDSAQNNAASVSRSDALVAPQAQPAEAVPSNASKPAASDQPKPEAPAQDTVADKAQAAQKQDALELKIHEDSWVEVRNASGKVLLSRLMKAGETESIAVASPLSLVIGNAAGVEANLRGAPLAVKPIGKSNVVRLTVK